MKNKGLFSYFEGIFDIGYLLSGFCIGLWIWIKTNSSTGKLFALTAFVLIIGDSFHLLPRIGVVMTKKPEKYKKALGFGKMITSVSMGLFYYLLWEVGKSLYGLSISIMVQWIMVVLLGLRIILSLMPQNRWTEEGFNIKWAIIRNIPFVFQGILVGILYFNHRFTFIPFKWMWMAIGLSFVFYLPVLWAKKKPLLGMLMLPKTLMYLWILSMGLAL